MIKNLYPILTIEGMILSISNKFKFYTNRGEELVDDYGNGFTIILSHRPQISEDDYFKLIANCLNERILFFEKEKLE